MIYGVWFPERYGYQLQELMRINILKNAEAGPVTLFCFVCPCELYPALTHREVTRVIPSGKCFIPEHRRLLQGALPLILGAIRLSHDSAYFKFMWVSGLSLSKRKFHQRLVIFS